MNARYSKTLVAAAVSLALGQYAGAQDAQANPSGGEEVETVLVTGIRASLGKSLEVKRQSTAVVDVINAEDVGKFPDKNVAEALQRVSGVSISRDFGDGERVSIRGSAPNLNRTLLNGHAIATADWFVLDQLSATRSFNYLMLPTEVIGSTEVIKGSQADLDEGGIGGTVNIKTRNPLDMPAATFAASLEGSYTELSDSTDPQAGALFSWKNDANTVGVLIAGLYQKRNLRRDGIEFLGYSDHAIDDQDGAVLALPDLLGSTLFVQERVRTGANFGLQFKPSDKLDINITGLYSKLDANNFNHNYMAWFSQMIGAQQPTNTTVNAGGTLVGGTFAMDPVANGVVYDAILRDAKTETMSGDIDLSFKATDSLTLHTQVGYTKAKGETTDQPFWETQAHTGFTWDFSRGVPEISFNDIADRTDPNSLPTLGWASDNQFLNDDDEFYVYGDAEFKVEMGAISSFKFGVKYTDHERDVNITYGQTRGLLGATGCDGHACGLVDAAGSVTPGDFLADIARPGTVDSYRLVSEARLRQIYGALDFIQYDPNDPDIVANWPNFPTYHFGPLESFTVNEKALGGFAMANFAGEGFRGNFGVRVVQTKQTSDGWAVGVPAATPGAVANPFGLMAPLSIDHDYTDVLPSANVVFDLSDSLLLRMGASRVMARPEYNRIAPTITSLTPLLFTGAGGNPTLDPYRADQFDLSAEWYFAPESLLSAALFYKDVQSYVINGAGPERLPTEIIDPNDARLSDPDADCQSIGPALYNCIYSVDRPVNGSGGKIQGVELTWQQPIYGGFGALVNYTYAQADSQTDDPIPGNSKNSGNVTAYFENDRFGARLSYNYRSEYFIDNDRGRQLYSDATDSLDLSINVNLTDSLSLTLDGVNLLDEELFQYYDNDKGRPARFYDNGPVYYLGVRFNLGR
ncbi:MAG TPA: TonB-dependent receptor [Steroidobacteraceae bacterium]|nr:TonB-dependent receptor [Steroidobacteraceae bacterium]